MVCVEIRIIRSRFVIPVVTMGNVSSDPPSVSFVVVVGDIVKSREMTDRADAQDRIREVVETFNDRAPDALEAPLQLTGGDEMKAILSDPSWVVDMITWISEAVHPIELVWGIGRGLLETSWVPDVGALDGPCFHRARHAVEESSREGNWVTASGFSKRDDRLLSVVFGLMGAIRDSWTDRQVGYIRSVREMSQKATAEEFGVSESAVSQSLRRARYKEIVRGEAVLRDLLGSYTDDRFRPQAEAERVRDRPT